MKLKQLFESQFITDHDKVVEWIIDNLYDEHGKEITEDKIEVGPDGKVTLGCGVIVHPEMKEIKVQFKSVSNIFDASDALLKTFDGCPEEVRVKDSSTTHAAKFRGTMNSIKNITKRANTISISGCHKIISLENVYDHIERCDQISLPPTIQSNILGLMKIKDLKFIGTIVYAYGKGPGQTPGLAKAIKIINKHLNEGRSIVKAQQELIDADLDDYAEL